MSRAPGHVPADASPWRVCHINLARGFRGGERQTELLIRELSARGVAQRLLARTGEPLISGAVEVSGDRAGIITAGATSPYLGHGIGYALMDTAEHGLGSRVMVGCRDGSMQEAELIELPFYDKLAEIPRGKKVDIPSYQVRPGDEITFKDRSMELLAVTHAIDTLGVVPPEWISVDNDARKISIINVPSRAQIDTQVEEQLIVELYSK